MTKISNERASDSLTPEGKRRKVLTSVFMGLVGFAGAFATRRKEALAANGAPLILGQGNSANDTTTLSRTGDIHDPAFRVTNNEGPGVVASGGDRWEGIGGESDGYGVIGQNNGSVYPQNTVAGVYGTSRNNDGVAGLASNATRNGVYGEYSGSSPYGFGVTGRARQGGVGVMAISNSGWGIRAETISGPFAIVGQNTSPQGIGVYASGGSAGVLGRGPNVGVRGELTGPYGDGVIGVSTANQGGDTGVRGEARGSGGTGVWGQSFGGRNGWGVLGVASPQGQAGVFSGDVKVYGTLTKSAGGFQIDHPLDPANKYLYHSFVESPDMMNVYGGNVVTDANGNATITLPNYFATLNRDFRYHLTVIGQLGLASVIDEIKENQFSIKTDKPNMKVSWQVTGIRQDPYAKSHPILPEVEKPDDERGTYLSPGDYGQPESRCLPTHDMGGQRALYVNRQRLARLFRLSLDFLFERGGQADLYFQGRLGKAFHCCDFHVEAVIW